MSKVMKALVFAGAAAIVLTVPVFAGGSVSAPEPSGIMMLAGGLGAVAGLRYFILRRK